MSSRSVVSALMAASGLAVQPLLAQSSPLPGRLTVQAFEATRGPRTNHVGEHKLDSFPRRANGTAAVPWVYVPQQCAGAQRCPLLVFAWASWALSKEYMRPMADKFGMIVLSPVTTDGYDESDNGRLDEVLKQVFGQFAIDPNRIALMGTCGTGPVALRIGGDNLDLFSRVIVLSAAAPSTATVDSPQSTTEFLLDDGYPEASATFVVAQELRHRGHRVTHAVGFRRHGNQVENFDFVARWLQTSWTIPAPKARPASQIVADPLPVLTTDMLAKMIAFWTRFRSEPESIRTTARQAHLRNVTVPVGKEQVVTDMVDMSALAVQYPSVAAAFQAAGLTPQEHDAYRVALASAVLTRDAGRVVGAIDPTSTIGENILFIMRHADELQALDATPMWLMP